MPRAPSSDTAVANPICVRAARADRARIRLRTGAKTAPSARRPIRKIRVVSGLITSDANASARMLSVALIIVVLAPTMLEVVLANDSSSSCKPSGGFGVLQRPR